MSLSTRISLLVLLLLATCGVAAGRTFHRAVRRSADAEIRGRLDARIAWLEGAVQVELDDGEVQLEARDEPAGAADHWQVTADLGRRVLWGSAGTAPAAAATTSRRVSFGSPPPPGTPAPAVTLVDAATGASSSRAGWAETPVDDVPRAAIEAARAAVPGLDVQRAWRKARVKKGAATPAPTLFDLRGTAGGGGGAGREHDVRVDATGRVLRSKGRDASRYPEYQLVVGEGGADAAPANLELVLTASASTAARDAELARTARALWTLGPAALLATGAALALAIRWQLRPLARLARRAAAVGPDHAGLGPAGSRAAELVQVHRALDAMIGRLSAAIERERRFASSAAHELRTPLAQMRLTLDVTLRRPRDADGYRAALADLSADVAGLENLVAGLLQLTRAPAGASRAGVPVSLLPLLRRAADARGPARIEHAPEDEGVRVLGDADLLEAAVANVLANAARYAPGAPPEVRVRAGAGTAQVIVADRGPGIPEDDRERVFEPLTRLDAGRTVGPAPDGFGLGLAVARSAVRAFGGDLVCRPRGDGARGAEFVFTFRRADGPSPVAPAGGD